MPRPRPKRVATAISIGPYGRDTLARASQDMLKLIGHYCHYHDDRAAVAILYTSDPETDRGYQFPLCRECALLDATLSMGRAAAQSLLDAWTGSLPVARVVQSRPV